MLLWDKFKSDIMKTTKVQWANVLSSSLIMGTLTLSWVFYIFIPVMEQANIYAETEQDPNMIIAGSMMGFIMLSLWFTVTWLNFTLCRLTMRLIVFLFDSWETINTKRNNKNRSVN